MNQNPESSSSAPQASKAGEEIYVCDKCGRTRDTHSPSDHLFEAVARSENQRSLEEKEPPSANAPRGQDDLKGELDKELGRWQDEIRDFVIMRSGAPDYKIDGGGCDSGDPLDLTLSEIGLGINFVLDELFEARAFIKMYFVDGMLRFPDGRSYREHAKELLSRTGGSQGAPLIPENPATAFLLPGQEGAATNKLRTLIEKHFTTWDSFMNRHHARMDYWYGEHNDILNALTSLPAAVAGQEEGGEWTARKVHTREPSFWALVVNGKDLRTGQALDQILLSEQTAKAICAAHNASLREKEEGKGFDLKTVEVLANDLADELWRRMLPDNLTLHEVKEIIGYHFGKILDTTTERPAVGKEAQTSVDWLGAKSTDCVCHRGKGWICPIHGDVETAQHKLLETLGKPEASEPNTHERSDS